MIPRDWSALLSRCRLCPRCCNVDRTAGRKGYCGASDRLQIYRVAPHPGEEPPLSGTRGSGTIFFSRCTLRCGYCQNFPWSVRGEGAFCGVEELTAHLETLHARGCHNWNLVSPTPWLPMIAAALEEAKKDGVSLPVVYNTSGFESRDTLETFARFVDVYLPDLRYASSTTAAWASDAPDYVGIARAAVEWMWRRAGPLRVDAKGIAVSGVICRVLVLPGHAEEAVASLEWLAKVTRGNIAVSVMCQYRPVYRAAEGGLGEGWQRTITRAEYDLVCSAVERLGLQRGWVQEFGENTTEHLLGCNMKRGTPARRGREEKAHERTQQMGNDTA